jgi:hypothetical protein
MLNATLGDAIGPFVTVGLLVVTALYSAWLLLVRLAVARKIRAGTILPDAGIAVLRRLNSGVLGLAVGCAFFSAPFSPFGNPNPHATTIATVVVVGFALIAYASILVAVRRIQERA